ncbi:ParA family protein [Bacteroides reticulotermitis]|uniref:Conjugative transposon protein TraA n=2 Tax=Bacteroides reticulotermitis TaxID=1133319 RepID=W4UVF1_9BACE|nr:AAA family ATPase [Bacteroides reticulotermitis]MBB4045766.1 cellulose biosynthesis protein BcsQ [Bacteroides reticulotermitis]GAE84906.1 conjugative transposon protein TraA [Bacteroides reticulotermitis JCM 10512]
MKKEPLFVALSNQKGGVGKSTLTVLLASYFHYCIGKNVLVVDCDYPQHSIRIMREWDVKNVEKNARLQGLLVEQFGDTGRKAYNILSSTPQQAKKAAYDFIDRSDIGYDMVLVDLPGTVNTTGVFQSIINMDYVFTPVTQERMVMQSSMTFVLAIREYLNCHKEVPLQGIYMFWNKMDKRVSKELYNAYMTILRSLNLPVLDTTLPRAERYNKDAGQNGQIFRSTLFSPSAALLKGSNLDLLAGEIEKITGL